MAASGAKSPAIELDVGDRTVRISNPDRVYYGNPRMGQTFAACSHQRRCLWTTKPVRLSAR